jgi:hypothetical protein
MAHHYVFSIRDRKSSLHGPLFIARSIPDGIRGFSDAVSDPKSQWAKYPADYELVHVASIDEITGVVVTGDNMPATLGLALDYIREVVK